MLQSQRIGPTQSHSPCLVLLPLAAVLATPPGTARADETPPDPVVLRWDVEPGAAEGCAPAEEIAARVDTVLERQAFEPEATAAPWAPTLRVRLLPLDASGRQRAIVTLVPAELDEAPGGDEPAPRGSTRELIAPRADCRSLDEPLALVIALMIDAELGSEPASEPSPAPPEPEPEPTPPDPEESGGPILTAPSLQSESERPWGFDAGVALLGSLGSLPGPALGGELSAAVTTPARFGLRVHGAAFLPQEEPFGENASADFVFAYGGLDACLTTDTDGGWRFRPCVGASIGWLHVDPRGLERAVTATQILAAAEAKLVVGYRVVDGWLATGSLGALFPIEPNRFVFERADGRPDRIFQQTPIALVAGVGMAVDVR